MSFIRFQLTSYKRPAKIIILDALPATSTGKIRQAQAREVFAPWRWPSSSSADSRISADELYLT